MSDNDNDFGVDNIKNSLDEATAEGLLKKFSRTISGEAEAMQITFLALARIGGKAAAVVIKMIMKLLKKAGVEIKKMRTK
tara:strand:+ start:52 stop:291 length:240 start_codon:yes stop_codon:yes gene_type:complete